MVNLPSFRGVLMGRDARPPAEYAAPPERGVARSGSVTRWPTNENSNGLLRQYFPKGSDLRVYSADDLRHVEERINTRPRKTLAWATPAQIMAAAIASP
jgi:hypothetical protein